ncbi:hypothetical protein KAJ83_09600 [Marivibrio halodurans]|uniref:Uncharacterized protein n=1 Tax=Marivibrio halodurans TaxID=2039722 RepID=A0A8J7V2U2_9PROT|nr:host-nuclease inhibitor Gam family protein [Marivibrio halodurans]MBP5857262.1 hypothetical protein [Marivibrio halodurans]
MAKAKAKTPAKDGGAAKSAALEEIETRAQAFASAHDVLEACVIQVEAEVREIHARHAAVIREAAEQEAAAKKALTDEIDRNRSLFARPKSRTIYGVKLGLRKGQDTLELGDESALVARIDNQLPDRVDQLVDTKRTIVRSAVKKLEKAVLQRLGVKYVQGADEPFVAIEESDAEKMAQAILDSAAGGGR